MERELLYNAQHIPFDMQIFTLQTSMYEVQTLTLVFQKLIIQHCHN